MHCAHRAMRNEEGGRSVESSQRQRGFRVATVRASQTSEEHLAPGLARRGSHTVEGRGKLREDAAIGRVLCCECYVPPLTTTHLNSSVSLVSPTCPRPIPAPKSRTASRPTYTPNRPRGTPTSSSACTSVTCPRILASARTFSLPSYVDMITAPSSSTSSRTRNFLTAKYVRRARTARRSTAPDRRVLCLVHRRHKYQYLILTIDMVDLDRHLLVFWRQ